MKNVIILILAVCSLLLSACAKKGTTPGAGGIYTIGAYTYPVAECYQYAYTPDCNLTAKSPNLSPFSELNIYFYDTLPVRSGVFHTMPDRYGLVAPDQVFIEVSRNGPGYADSYNSVGGSGQDVNITLSPLGNMSATGSGIKMVAGRTDTYDLKFDVHESY